MLALEPTLLKIKPQTFQKVCDMLYRLSGIVLRAGKEDLVQSRLAKRLRATRTATYEEYLERVARDPQELSLMVDVLTTNKTHFFREPAHFDFLADQLVPKWSRARDPVRIWSAACSTGEEPYTIAMALWDASPEVARRSRILATDLASHVLTKAKAGAYRRDGLNEVPGELLKRHFDATSKGEARVKAPLRELVKFARLNLLDPWPMRGPFQLIFCRNVMIYFDKETQLALAERFRELLEPGGYLFIGHSESLGLVGHGLKYVQPAVYQR